MSETPNCPETGFTLRQPDSGSNCACSALQLFLHGGSGLRHNITEGRGLLLVVIVEELGLEEELVQVEELEEELVLKE